MTTLIALVITSSLIYDSVHAKVIHCTNLISPPYTRSLRANYYSLFGLKLFNLLPPPPPPSYYPLSFLTQYILPSFQQLNLSWLFPTTSAGRETPLNPLLYHSDFISRASDSLNIPAACFYKRITAWLIDSVLVFLISRLITVRFRPLISALVWLGRDLWLSSLGLPSPGRWLTSQTVISTKLASNIQSKFCSNLSQQQPLTLSSLHMPTLRARQLQVSDYLLQGQYFESDAYLLLLHNSLRIFLSTLGPFASFVWFMSTCVHYYSTNLHVWDGRTIWDRWIGVQVIDNQTLYKMVVQMDTTGAHTEEEEEEEEGSDSGSNSFVHLRSNDHPMSSSELFVPPVQYYVNYSVPDPDEYVPLTPSLVFGSSLD